MLFQRRSRDACYRSRTTRTGSASDSKHRSYGVYGPYQHRFAYLSQAPGDARGPGVDSCPVAEVAFGGSHGLHHQSFGEGQLVVVEDAEEYLMIPWFDSFLELGHLFGLLLGILNLGAEWAAAKQPYRVLS